MVFEDILDELHRLDRAKKLRIIQILAADLAEEEDSTLSEIQHYDALWDKTFENSQDLLNQLAEEAHDEYLAGLTEDFDPDTETP